MNHTHYDLGYQQAGNVVRVHLSGDAPNVRLLDDSNYRIYCSGTGDFREYGGIAARTFCPCPCRTTAIGTSPWTSPGSTAHADHR